MLYIYRFLINLIFILSPIIVIYRLLIKKESLMRVREKFCLFSEKRRNGKLLWFHGASVGELQSIVPLLEKFEKDTSIKQILVTSNTLSSSTILKKYKFKKTIHQFFPIDTNFLSKNFLNYWKPNTALFIDSEIWPNMIFNLKSRGIKIILLNGRITKKTFNKWRTFKIFSKEIFGKFDLCISSSKESKGYLKKLGVKAVKFFGNLKYSQSENKNTRMGKNLEKFFFSRKIWCASSTHKNEELLCGLVHKELKKKFKNLLTIIIPRHINRARLIKEELINLNLNVHIHEPKRKIDKLTDIYIVNTYGSTKSFYKICKNVFLGGSIINHGGQNPLEAARYGCNILHGNNVSNFKEIYNFLKQKKIATRTNNKKEIINSLEKFFTKNKSSFKIQKKLNSIGKKILKTTHKEILSNI